MNLFYCLPLRQAVLTGLRFTLLALLIAGPPSACSKKEDVAPPTVCKIASTTYQENGSSSTETWTYLADGQLKSVSSSKGYKTNYTYDANGYLTAAANLNASGSVSNSSRFEYTNGQLAKFTNYDAAGTTVSVTQYAYDAAGNISKYVEQNVGGNTYTYLYSAGKQTGYLIKTAAGSESQPCTFDNGLVKRYTSGTSQANYEYDAQGRRTRYEIVSNGKLTNYTVYEYTDGTAADRAQSSYKGIYDLLVRGGNQSGINVGLIARQTNYTVNAGNVAARYVETSITYKKNTDGFPLEANALTTYYDAAGNVSSTSTYKYTYLYTGCQ